MSTPAPSSSPDREPDAHGYAKLPNGMIDRGWLRILTKNQLAVLLVFIRHVGARDGITFVGAERISALTGIAVTHVQRATAALVGYGILVTTDRGGGRNRPRKRVVCFPETPADSAGESTPTKPPQIPSENPRSFSHETPADSDHKPPQIPRDSTDYSKDYSKDLINNTGENAAAVGDGDENFSEQRTGGNLSETESDRIADVQTELAKNGVANRKVLAELSAIAGLTPLLIQELDAGIGPRCRNRPGVLITKIRDEAPAMIVEQKAEFDAFIAQSKFEAAEAERRNHEAEARREEMLASIAPKLSAARARYNADPAAFDSHSDSLNGKLNSTVAAALNCDIDAVDGTDAKARLVLAVDFLAERERRRLASKCPPPVAGPSVFPPKIPTVNVALHPAPAPPTPEALEAERQRQLRELGLSQ